MAAQPLNYEQLLERFHVRASDMDPHGGYRYQYDIPVTFSTPPKAYSLRITFKRALDKPGRYFKVIRQGTQGKGVYIEIALFNKLDNSWIENAGITETMIINNIRPYPDPDPPAENAPAAAAAAAGGKRRRTKKSKKSKRKRSFK